MQSHLPQFAETAKVLLAAMTNTMKSNSKELEFRNENGYMTLVRQVVDWIFQYCKDVDVSWFMDSAMFPAAAREEEHATFKTAKFKKMLQIDFSNEYVAGFRLLHFFCLELQASALNQDGKFATVISDALTPEIYGGVYGDANKPAREFLLRCFMKPYLVEATKNQAAKVFLEPVLNTIVSIFAVQSDIGCLAMPQNMGSVIDVLTTLKSFLWINMERILMASQSNSNSTGSGYVVDYWVWKCTAECFSIGIFLVQAAAVYNEKSPLTTVDETETTNNIESCLISLIDLCMFIIVHLVCEFPKTMPDLLPPLPSMYTLSGVQAGSALEPPDTSAMSFYKPILSSFISQISFDRNLKVWKTKQGMPVVQEASFNSVQEKSKAEEQMYTFLRAVSFLPWNRVQSGLLGLEKLSPRRHFWRKHGDMVETLKTDSRSKFRYLNFLNPRYPEPQSVSEDGFEDDGFGDGFEDGFEFEFGEHSDLLMGVGTAELESANSTLHLSSAIDDLIF